MLSENDDGAVMYLNLKCGFLKMGVCLPISDIDYWVCKSQVLVNLLVHMEVTLVNDYLFAKNI